MTSHASTGQAAPTGTAAGGSSSYARTSRTTPSRSRERVAYDRELVHSILDDDYVCHLGFVRDGLPAVLPTLYARVDEHLYVHGSTGSRPLREASESDPGMPVCVTVTRVDGLVLAKSAFHHSINYRTVVAHGIAHQVTDHEERLAALDAIVESVLAGRADDSRRANAKELAATAVLRLDLEEVSAKTRTGGPNEEREDLELPYWSGVLPVTRTYGTPAPAEETAPGTPLPAYLTADRLTPR
ncbi:pyridoxamine 5'-phosphate oxidase family protein [Streptomyces iconiensis]|uniref:Pyridoxamine 5'-phosphate oxidase family protein n=1 Tax=Streptomyces iconiensis TaxID=1384038 RepID=A0ABT7A2Z2_9ACTN|nr:pyridoxamine 5'-phosphate oxidase family protein [Streptomyces iconiensis]MDJ1135690.1 pyridoxamine 5'-phosphate oxidase family protein [Streptomyces iconiensis]